MAARRRPTKTSTLAAPNREVLCGPLRHVLILPFPVVLPPFEVFPLYPAATRSLHVQEHATTRSTCLLVVTLRLPFHSNHDFRRLHRCSSCFSQCPTSRLLSRFKSVASVVSCPTAIPDTPLGFRSFVRRLVPVLGTNTRCCSQIHASSTARTTHLRFASRRRPTFSDSLWPHPSPKRKKPEQARVHDHAGCLPNRRHRSE